MKKIVITLIVIFTSTAQAQITLKECIMSGLNNKPNLNSLKSQVYLANLKSIENKAKYLPQISLAYDYRYNPIIQTQIVPVGQFNPIPSDETRAIQFGTDWQQNAGITFYQPIIDFVIQSRIKESKISASISKNDLKKEQLDLNYEITKCYSQIINDGYRIEEAIADTIRSYKSYLIIKSRYKEGKVLKTELNNALINHNTNVINYKKAFAALVNEKIFLHYLTNIKIERILEEKFNPINEEFYNNISNLDNVILDSLPEYEKLNIREKLVKQQIKTERNKLTPSIGFSGFIGANQYSQTLEPFKDNSWFGNSYIGLSVKLPVFSAEKSINGGKQLNTQLLIIDDEKKELKSSKNKDLMKNKINVDRLKNEISILESSLLLKQENIKLFQDQLNNGQESSYNLNIQELELQKLSSQLMQLKEELNHEIINGLYISGNLSVNLKSLK